MGLLLLVPSATAAAELFFVLWSCSSEFNRACGKSARVCLLLVNLQLIMQYCVPAGQARHEDWRGGPGRAGPHGGQVGKGFRLRGAPRLRLPACACPSCCLRRWKAKFAWRQRRDLSHHRHCFCLPACQTPHPPHPLHPSACLHPLSVCFCPQVTVISTSPNKKAEALESLGAHNFVVSKNEEEMAAAAGTLHGIIDTVAGAH